MMAVMRTIGWLWDRLWCFLGIHAWMEDPGIEGVSWTPWCLTCKATRKAVKIGTVVARPWRSHFSCPECKTFHVHVDQDGYHRSCGTYCEIEDCRCPLEGKS